MSKCDVTMSSLFKLDGFLASCLFYFCEYVQIVHCANLCAHYLFIAKRVKETEKENDESRRRSKVISLVGWSVVSLPREICPFIIIISSKSIMLRRRPWVCSRSKKGRRKSRFWMDMWREIGS